MIARLIGWSAPQLACWSCSAPGFVRRARGNLCACSFAAGRDYFLISPIPRLIVLYGIPGSSPAG